MRQRQPEAELAHQAQVPTGVSTSDTQVRGRRDFFVFAYTSRYASTCELPLVGHS
jgi:hypothetical protein